MSKYKSIKRSGHPLASGGKYISAHRYILYEKIGPGEHPCHWCGNAVTWLPGQGTRKGALIVDHLDADPGNNSADNLVPACQACNLNRSSQRVQDHELFLVRKNGTRLRAIPAVCEFCGSDFAAIPAQRKVGKARFCSRSCARSG